MNAWLMFPRALTALLPGAALALTLVVRGSAPAPLEAPPACGGAEASLDVDGDGRPERVVLARYGGELWLDVFAGGGGAAPALRSTTRVANEAPRGAGLVTVDVDGDGRMEVLVRTGDTTRAWRSTGVAFEPLAAATPRRCG